MPSSHISSALPWQRGALLAGAVLGCIMVISACGSSSPAASVAQLGTTTTTKPASSKGLSGGNNDSPLAYARCMRAHGVPDFPDPNSQGGFTFQGGPNSDLGPDSPAFQNANADCQSLTPTSGLGQGPSPAQIAKLQAQALKFSECMRSHGLTDFPDPVFHSGGHGGISISIKGGPGSDLSPSSPAFQAAQQACQKVLPGSKGGGHFSSSGPSGGGGAPAPVGNAGQSNGG